MNWTPIDTFDSGVRKTVQWYLDNQAWCQHVQDGSYLKFNGARWRDVGSENGLILAIDTIVSCYRYGRYRNPAKHSEKMSVA